MVEIVGGGLEVPLTKLAGGMRRSLADAAKSALSAGGARAFAPARPEAALPLAHRLAIVYLALPLLIWLLSWLEWWIGLPSAIALVCALRDALRGRWLTAPARWPWAVLLFAALWTATAATFGTHRGDWLTHAAIFLDMQRGSWPTYLVDHIGNDPPLLRYHLGWYVVPAVVAKWFGAWTLNWTVPLWTWAGLALVLALFVRGMSRRRAVAVAVVVAFLFSGMDVVEYALRFALSWQRLPRSWGDMFWEAGMWDSTTVESPMQLEYQSQAVTFGYTPHHFIPAGIGTLLLVQLRYRRRFLAVSGVVLAACVFWSAFVSVGLLPFAAALLLANGPRRYRTWLTWRNLLVAPLLLGLAGLYFTSGKLDFPSGWLWTLYDNGWGAVADVALVYACEFLVLAAVLWRLRPRFGRDPFFLGALVVLFVAPWWYWGSEAFSELLVRITIAPLFLLSYLSARALGVCAVKVRRRRRVGVEGGPKREGRGAAAPALVCVVALGAVSAFNFHAGMLQWPGLLRFERVGHSVLIDSYYEAAMQRLTRGVSGPLATVLRDNDDRVQALRGPAKGQLLFQSAAQPFHEAYLLENRLLFVTRRLCRRGERLTRFLVRVHGGEAGDAAHGGGESRAVQRLDFASRSITEHKCCNNCVWALPLPRRAFDRIVAGQRVAGTLRWMAEFRFAGGRHVATDTLFDDTAAAYREKYAEWMRRPRIAGDERGGQQEGEGKIARWNMHLADGVVAYTKAPCAWADGEARFFLHAFPERDEALPEERRVAGFENLDFDFDARGGVMFDGKCLVERSLPGYPLRALRSGQFSAGGDVLWRIHVSTGDGG